MTGYRNTGPAGLALIVVAILLAGPPVAHGNEAAISAARKLVEAGKHDEAIKQLSSTLNSAGLSPAERARAFYLRGVAYDEAKKHAQAIADLTSAIWIKQLPGDERAEAEARRAKAYAALGLKSPSGGRTRSRAQQKAEKTSAPSAANASASTADPAQSTAVTANAAQQTTSRGARASNARVVPAGRGGTWPATSSPNASQSAGFSLSDWFSGGSSSQSEPQGEVITPDSVPDSVVVSQAATARTSDGVYLPRRRTRRQELSANVDGWQVAAVTDDQKTPSTVRLANQAGKSAEPASQGPDITGFFSSLFSGGSSNQASEPSDENRQAAQPATSREVLDGGGGPAVSSWSTSSEAEAQAEPQPQQKQQVASTSRADTNKPKAARGGQFRLQVAAVRDPEEAQAIAASLMQKHASLLGNARPDVDDLVLGNMGTFYRVTVGPFDAEDSSADLCNKLRQTGTDCFIVKR